MVLYFQSFTFYCGQVPCHRLVMEMATINAAFKLFIVQVHPQLLLLQSKCASVSTCACPVIRFVFVPLVFLLAVKSVGRWWNSLVGAGGKTFIMRALE